MTVPAITSFVIEGLRGGVSVRAKIDNNTLILVGENGSGKTTVLRILFYFLSGRWASLRQFHFSSISIVVNNEKYTVTNSEIERIANFPDDRALRSLPPSQRRRFVELNRMGRYAESGKIWRNYTAHYATGEQVSLFDSDTDQDYAAVIEKQENVSSLLQSQILYLPTYRRIERELGSIIQGYESDDERRANRGFRQLEDADDYVELVEFGMNDVKLAIDRALESIRNFQLQGVTRLSVGYLGDVVSQAYLNTDRHDIETASDETIQAVLNRVDVSILSMNDKSKLRDIVKSARATANVPSEHEKIVYHYFTRLVRFQKEVEVKERNIRAFCDLCSKYIVDKKFIYESSEFLFRIYSPRINEDVPLSELSSGEKQIVSLFSHLYLSGRDKFFVLIDEPELSLSVPWQRRFLLDIRDASFCSGLIAVTHSPFIYDNRLKSNARSLGEFISGPDWGHIDVNA